MNILITGHQGFVGSHLYNRLASCNLYGLDKKSGFDLADYYKLINYFSDKDIDYIYHLAANCSTSKSLKNPVLDFNDNAVATFNICELAREKNARLIFTSSCKAKPNQHGIRTPYGLSKYVGELYIQEYAKCYGLEYVINRPGTIYGPGQEGSEESGWLSWFLRAKRENKKITIFGDGQQVRDVLHVDDYVELLVDQMDYFEKYQGEIYDVGGGEDNAISLLELLRFIDYDNFEYGSARVGDVKRFVSDNKKISKVNNWQPEISWKQIKTI